MRRRAADPDPHAAERYAFGDDLSSTALHFPDAEYGMADSGDVRNDGRKSVEQHEAANLCASPREEPEGRASSEQLEGDAAKNSDPQCSSINVCLSLS